MAEDNVPSVDTFKAFLILFLGAMAAAAVIYAINRVVLPPVYSVLDSARTAAGGGQ